MKKYDEGYVLAYVTVVLLIFCLVATAILTGAFRNLQSQQDANARMQDQYIAAGRIEKVLAQWNTYKEHAKDGEVGDTGVVWGECENGEYELIATYGSVSITCRINAKGEYLSYDVGAAPPETTGAEEGMP